MANVKYSNASAVLKEVYIDRGIENAVPETDKLAMAIPLSKRYDIGKEFHEPLEVAPAQGMTFGGEDSDAYAINTPKPPTLVDATLKTSSFVQQLPISNDILKRLGTGKVTTDKKRSFISGMNLLMKSLSRQASFAREISMLHGQRGIGTITGTVVSGSGTTTQVWAISSGTWARMIWQRMLNGNVDIYNGSSQVNSTSTVYVSAYDNANKRITLVGTSSTELDNIATGYTVWPQGMYGKCMAGVSLVCGSTSSTIYGLSQSTYPNLQSNTISAGSSILTYDAVAELMAAIFDRGLESKTLNLLCSAKTMKDLKGTILAKTMKKASDIKYDDKTNELGFDDEVTVKLVTHGYAFPNEAIILPYDIVERIGWDLEFIKFGDGSYLKEMENNHGALARVCWNQACLIRNAGHTGKITAIVNKGD